MTHGIRLFEGTSGQLLVPSDPSAMDQVVGWDPDTQTWISKSGGGGGAVDSVFGRSGAVVAEPGDYAASQVINDSSVAGDFVDDALNALATAISLLTPLPSGNGMFGRVAGVVSTVAFGVGALLSNGSTATFGALNLASTQAVAGPANTFLTSNGTTNSWSTLFTAPASPGDNGKLVAALNGDFTYVTQFSIAGPIGVNNAAPVLNLGAVGGATGTTPATSGVVRGNNVFSIWAVNNAGTSTAVFDWNNTASASVTLGDGSNVTNISYRCTTQHTFRIGATSRLTITSASVIPNAQISWDVASVNTTLTQAEITSGVSGKTIQILGQPLNGASGTAGNLDMGPGPVTFTGASTAVVAGNGVLHGGDVTSSASGTRTAGNLDLRGGLVVSGGAGATNGYVQMTTPGGTSLLRADATGLGFYAQPTLARQTITGSRLANPALADLLTKLATQGLWIDGTTA